MSYISALLSVLKDLGRFIVKRSEEVSSSSVVMPEVLAIAPPDSVPPDTVPSAPSTMTQYTVYQQSTVVDTVKVIGTYTEAFVVVSEAAVRAEPLMAFDSALARLPYATVVTMVRHEGRFTYIHYSGGSGWVYKDHLVARKEVVYPQLVSGVTYDSYSAETQAIRRLLNDEFMAAPLLLPLQSVEYVAYRLQLAGRLLTWGKQRPRQAGRWHTLLEGHREVHSGMAPRTGSVMEYVTAEGQGYVAYTEIVRPDGSVVVAGVGKEREGQFLREELAPAIYLEWRPVWLVIG